jgi:hypothetical protein
MTGIEAQNEDEDEQEQEQEEEAGQTHLNWA